MSIKTQVLIYIIVLAVFDTIIPIPFTALVLIYVFYQKPRWFREWEQRGRCFVVVLFRGNIQPSVYSWCSSASIKFLSAGFARTRPKARLTDERSMFISRATSAPEIFSLRTAK